jgi:tetratricopeptide (TPR) repeat protein
MQKIDKEAEKKFLKAENHRANKDFNKAIEIFEDLIKQYPKLPPALHNIGLCYTSLNNHKEAEKFYLKCLETEPVSIMSINNLAKLYYNTHQFQKALPILKKSLLKNEDQLDIAEVTATCLFNLKLLEETNSFCQQALKKFPQSNVIKSYYGKNLLRSNKHSEGLKYLNECSGVVEFGENNFKIFDK